MKILVVTEQRQGKWNNTSFETLAAAQQIAKDTNGTVSALVIGKGVAAFADELAAKNVAEFSASNTIFSTPTRRTATASPSSKSSNPQNPISSSSHTRIKSAISPQS